MFSSVISEELVAKMRSPVNAMVRTAAALACLAGTIAVRADEPSSSPQAPRPGAPRGAASPQVLASPQVFASSQQPGLVVPPGLPRYDLDVRIDPRARRVTA